MSGLGVSALAATARSILGSLSDSVFELSVALPFLAQESRRRGFVRGGLHGGSTRPWYPLGRDGIFHSSVQRDPRARLQGAARAHSFEREGFPCLVGSDATRNALQRRRRFPPPRRRLLPNQLKVRLPHKRERSVHGATVEVAGVAGARSHRPRRTRRKSPRRKSPSRWHRHRPPSGEHHSVTTAVVVGALRHAGCRYRPPSASFSSR